MRKQRISTAVAITLLVMIIAAGCGGAPQLTVKGKTYNVSSYRMELKAASDAYLKASPKDKEQAAIALRDLGIPSEFDDVGNPAGVQEDMVTLILGMQDGELVNWFKAQKPQ
jgi:hypothetical protein